MLRPQDVLLLLALTTRGKDRAWTFADLARETGLSPGEAHKSLVRAEASGLYRSDARRPVRDALQEFLLHGVRYAFPAVRGPVVRGVPTGVAAPPLEDEFDGKSLSPELTPVWSSPSGARRGYSIEPLYRTVPAVAVRSPALYEALALTDALREGRARERSAARQALQDRLST
jgi:hypothetical protein